MEADIADAAVADTRDIAVMPRAIAATAAQGMLQPDLRPANDPPRVLPSPMLRPLGPVKKASVSPAASTPGILVFAGNGFRGPLTELAERYGAQSGSGQTSTCRSGPRTTCRPSTPLLVLMTYLHARNLRRSHATAHRS
jgi:hypothetical protein